MDNRTENFKCVDCGEDYTISDVERGRFRELNFDLPKRCFPCRKKRKLEKQGFDNGGGGIYR